LEHPQSFQGGEVRPREGWERMGGSEIAGVLRESGGWMEEMEQWS
jgi:hypothetical protein